MATREWIPPEDVRRNYTALLQALSNPAQHDHQASLRALHELVRTPEFILTMSYLFAHGGQQMHLSVRQLAGLLVKNEAFVHMAQLPQEHQQQVKQCMLCAMLAREDPIRVS